MAGRTTTGVTLQTLHPHKMDHGQVLAQTPSPGFPIPCPDEITVPELVNLVAPVGAEMLIQGLQDGLFVPPITDLASLHDSPKPELLRHAHKITPEDRHVNWKTWKTNDVLRKCRVIGPLWNHIECSPTQKLRIIWSSGFSKTSQEFDLAPGEAALSSVSSDHRLYVHTADGQILEAEFVTIEGLPKREAKNLVLQKNLVDENVKGGTINSTSIHKLKGLLV